MTVRDEVENLLRSWDRYERERGAPAIVDFDCAPVDEPVSPAAGRFTVLRRFVELRQNADDEIKRNIDSHVAYLRALMGERAPLDDYLSATQGCRATGWPAEYVAQIGDSVRERLNGLGIGWSATTPRDLAAAEGVIDGDAVSDAIRRAVAEAEPAVRRLVDSDAPYILNIEPTDVHAYWAYWLDGVGRNIRLRLNMRNATFTKVTVRQFALHEVLGHGLKAASYTARCTEEDVPWIRILCVHSPCQVLLEGLAQTLPLFATPEDDAVVARVELEHYSYLVRAELHIAINAGASVEECAANARTRIPWLTDDGIADFLADRSSDPLLRSYLWAYPAGQDWFTHLASADPRIQQMILRAAYKKPLTTGSLAALWPDGPMIGGLLRGK